MNPTGPEIGVVIPVHNGETYLGEAIQSILNQQQGSIELFVIDNASTDDTSRVAKGFKEVSYFFLEERGLVNALNVGVQAVSSPLLAFLDADDLWSPDKLALQLEVLESNPGVDMVFGHVEQFISPELKEEEKRRLNIRAARLPGYVRGAMLIRKQGFFRVGLFDDASKYGEFIDWYMRAQDENLQSVMLPDVVMRRRVHGGNTGYTDRSARIDYAHALKRGLDRRRRQGKA